MSELSEALHERLDAMGAPPRENAEPDDLDEGLEEDLEAEDDGEPLETEEDEDAVTEEGAEETEAAVVAKSGEKYKVADLANAIGWKPADLYNDLVVPFGNGESLTLGELKNRHETISQQQAELNQARQAIGQQFQQLQQQQQALVASARGVSEEIDSATGEMRAIEAQYSNVDWDKLDTEDPGRAANIRQKFATAYAQAKAKVETAKQKRAHEAETLRAQMIRHEDQRTLDLVPEWREPTLAREELPQITQYLLSKGFTQQELNTVYSASARAVARDAWLYNQQRQKADQALETVRKAPKKVLRAGKGGSAGAASEKKVRLLEKRAIESGNRNDRLAAARAILQSSVKR